MVRFRIKGSLRFLSHAETMAVLQRACVRAGINIRFSQGFNPRPRLSLPLPRPVGVESEDELFALRVTRDPYELPGENYESQIEAGLSAQLPEGFEVVSVRVAAKSMSFQPSSARYIIPVRQELANEELRTTFGRLLASESLCIRRETAGKRTRNVDVRAFLQSLELDGRDIIVECRITSAGSIRIDEILDLLGLSWSDLAAPIRRNNVQWQSS